MTTKYDVGETVLVPFKIEKISIGKDNKIAYTLGNIELTGDRLFVLEDAVIPSEERRNSCVKKPEIFFEEGVEDDNK